MKILLILVGFLLTCTSSFAQYPEVTIMDIQYQPDILTTGDQPSPLTGDTVTIKAGVVMVAPFRDANPDSGTTLIAGAPALILQDTAETEWAGILVRYPNMPAGNPFSILDTGTVITCTGVVVEYYKTTEFDLISFEAGNVGGFMQRPQPVVVTLDSLAELGGREGKLLAERWESVFIQVDTVTATGGGIGSGSYEIFDENNTQVIVGNQSSYFRNASIPTPGTLLKYTVGYIQNRDNVPGTTFANLINPSYPGDVEVLLYAPNVSNLTRNPVLVGYGDQVTVTVEIEDQDGTVDSVKLFYRKNIGVNNELMMANIGGDIYQANIPAQNDSSLIDFFVWAKDNDNNKTLYPADTSQNRFFYLVLDRPLTIQDVQYSPFGSGFSGYNGYDVTVRGIVTADISDLEGNETGTPSSPQVYIQNGNGPWSGVRIFGNEPELRNRGDEVIVSGPVFESFGVTQIGTVSSGATVSTVSTGNPLPSAEELSTAEIDDLSGGSVQAEQWEGVLIKYSNLTVTDENADGDPGPHSPPTNSNYGDILVEDESSSDTRVDLQDGTHQYHNIWFDSLATYPIRVKEGDTFESITGILWYSFGNYKLIPRKDDDFVGFVTDVYDQMEIPNEFSLTQNYPNPFNPSTKINYSLPVGANVTLKIYNILGQEVMTLINNELISAGNHEITFKANGLPSGIYIYSIRANDFVKTKKMLLLK